MTFKRHVSAANWAVSILRCSATGLTIGAIAALLPWHPLGEIVGIGLLMVVASLAVDEE